MNRFDSKALSEALATRTRRPLVVEGFRESAVLVPILVEAGLPERLILTLRRADLRSHAGQISFPGGKRDPGDLDIADTAVRETVEELAVPRTRIEVLGRLDEVPTPLGYNITPVVGRVDGPVEMVPEEHEVAEVLVLPIASLGDPAAYRHDGAREFNGVKYVMHEYHVGGRVIWGATARIVFQLLEVLRGLDAKMR